MSHTRDTTGTGAAAATTAVRPPAIAGTFYPATVETLRRDVERHLAQARIGWSGTPETPRAPRQSPDAIGSNAPKAIIAPHAGHVYSGGLAARAYARLDPIRDRLRRVVLIGPAHRVPFRGIALSSATAWRTPLGDVPIDHAYARRCLAGIPGIGVLDEAHAAEHCLEVHLPFLQETLTDWALVPLLVGRTEADHVARVLEALWGGPETAILISSDLSHFLDDAACRQRDDATAAAIEALNPAVIGPHDACGCLPVNGLLTLARDRGLRVERIGLCHSGDTAGPRDRVVGYGAWAFASPGETGPARGNADPAIADPIAATGALVEAHGATLIKLAAAGITHGLAHGRPPSVTLAALPNALRAPGAAFVTLTRVTDGALRGCIGSVEARRPLAEDVAVHGYDAAFRDHRFGPVTEAELPDLALSVSVLTPAVPLPFTDRYDLLREIRPGIDGLILEDPASGRRGLFLPQVWEQLPDPDAFLTHLVAKAGLPARTWSDRFRMARFETRGTKGTPWATDTPDPRPEEA